MNSEIPLTGGHVTQGVMRAGDTVRRPCGAHSAFVHTVLMHLQNTGLAPEYFGQDDSGREVLSFLPGFVPENIGFFTDEQCAEAARIIRRLHDALACFPDIFQSKAANCNVLCDLSGFDQDKTAGSSFSATNSPSTRRTVCHGDLSPCNFVFTAKDGLPRAVIDWDACHIGDAADDLAYALWMWLDIGNDEQDAAFVRRRISVMLAAYGEEHCADYSGASANNAILRCGTYDLPDMKRRILSQMHRVAQSIFPTPEQTSATRAWALSCAEWAKKYL